MSTFHKNAYISRLPSTILLLKRNQLIYSLISHNVHLGIKPPQKHHHLFFPSPLLNLQTFKVSFSRQPSLCIVFLWTNPKNQVFQWTPITYNFFLSLITIPSFKSNLILSLNLERKTFLLINVSDFRLFLCKNCTPPFTPTEKFNTHLKFVIMSSFPPALFLENVIGDSTPQQKWRGLHYVFLTYSTYLEPQKLVIFGLQLCPINHKNCRSWNLKTHIFWGKVWHHILKQINHFQWRHEVCPLNQFSCTKFNHLR